ncbi:carboxymuconolactone decarboxylase family protein [Archangium minus]|uniref:Carboxymuconolactone decarboxylase family protein n=1 Tax=Archangium minus TaxID=83450 RepID=A0ABY9WK11_9BACT|nr:carboxymuconolactone decarboxylase family protein [Archangium minus]
MARFQAIPFEEATGATAEVFTALKQSLGRIPNAYATLGSLQPAALKAMLAADKALAGGSLSKPDQETVKLVVSEAVGCDYCVAAHTLVGKMAGLSPEAMRQVRAGQPTGDAKRDALVRFVRYLLAHPGTLPDAEVSAILEAGYTPQQLVEVGLAISVITFTNVFNRINDTVLDFPKPQ